jgi:hypothetical protein
MVFLRNGQPLASKNKKCRKYDAWETGKESLFPLPTQPELFLSSNLSGYLQGFTVS